MPMKRRYRLRRPQDFARLKADGKVTKHPMMLVSILPNDLPFNRYGVITGKRLGNAVRRNRIRRVLSEGVQALHPHLKQGFDVVLVVRPLASDGAYAVGYKALMDTFRRAKLLLEDES
jgi:ribonuclease P protein component